jgi:hypothetical protein
MEFSLTSGPCAAAAAAAAALRRELVLGLRPAPALFCLLLHCKVRIEPSNIMSVPCFYSRGPGTYKVQEPLPVQARSKLVASMAKAGVSHGVILLKGGVSACR